jgi:hypothetical protein
METVPKGKRTPSRIIDIEKWSLKDSFKVLNGARFT